MPIYTVQERGTLVYVPQRCAFVCWVSGQNHRQYYLGVGCWGSGIHGEGVYHIHQSRSTWVGESVCYATPYSHSADLPPPKKYCLWSKRPKTKMSQVICQNVPFCVSQNVPSIFSTYLIKRDRDHFLC